MKKLLLIFGLLAIVSCSSDDSSSGGNEFNPPTWIHGTWGQFGNGTYRFTSNDFIILGGSDMSYKEYLKNIRETGGHTSVTESTNQTKYDCTITVTSVTQPYRFKKIDATHISFEYGSSTQETVLTKM